MFVPYVEIEASFMNNKEANTLMQRLVRGESRATLDFISRSISFQFYAEGESGAIT
jgi:hypothetical protein